MSESYRHQHADGSEYAIDLHVPEAGDNDKYQVDLVRHSQDEHGLPREQRQLLAAYNSYGEAEEHFYEAETQLQENGLADFDAEGITQLPYLDKRLLLPALYPPDAEGTDTASLHLLAISSQTVQTTQVANGAAEELQDKLTHLHIAQAESEERLLDTAATIAEEQQPHTPLFAPLEPHTAENKPPFIDTIPLDLPALNPDTEYYFGYGTSPNNLPALEAVKTWMDGTERRFDTLTIGEYGMFEEAAVDEWELEELQATQGLEAAMNLAESMAVASGYLDPERTDSRIFFADDAPPDPFTTHREQKLAQPRYSIGAISANGESFLDVYKEWGADDYERLVVPQNSWEQAHDTAIHANELLGDNLQSAMRLVELEAVKAGVLDPDREDPRLFTQGPPDPFETQCEQDNLFDRQTVATDPDYHFLSVPDADTWRLCIMKTWTADEQSFFATTPIAHYENPDDLNVQKTQLDELMRDERLTDAMHTAEQLAVQQSLLDPQRVDPRLFTQGPPDPFQTIRQAELQGQAIAVTDDIDTEELETPAKDYPTFAAEWVEEATRRREANASLDGIGWFEATFDTGDLLEPIDPTVNYTLVVEASDPWTLDLEVGKVWKAENGYMGYEAQTVQSYDFEDREKAEADRDTLRDIYDERGLDAMMHKAELQVMQNGYLDPHRADLGLFRDGPPDRFETLAQRLQGEINPYWNTEGEVIEEPEPNQPVENPYWRLDTIPVNDPEGEPLGHALHMVVYDGIEHDPERVGTPPMAENEPFRMLEMAHFDTPEAADKFGKEFNGYLMPGLLEGPELAVEVARLEELPVDWKSLEGDDLKAYQDGQYTLTREPSDWHPYNPNAERDARIAAEGMYTDTIRQFTSLGESENEQTVEPVSPDFDM